MSSSLHFCDIINLNIALGKSLKIKDVLERATTTSLRKDRLKRASQKTILIFHDPLKRIKTSIVQVLWLTLWAFGRSINIERDNKLYRRCARTAGKSINIRQNTILHSFSSGIKNCMDITHQNFYTKLYLFMSFFQTFIEILKVSYFFVLRLIQKF